MRILGKGNILQRIKLLFSIIIDIDIVTNFRKSEDRKRFRLGDYSLSVKETVIRDGRGEATVKFIFRV